MGKRGPGLPLPEGPDVLLELPAALKAIPLREAFVLPQVGETEPHPRIGVAGRNLCCWGRRGGQLGEWRRVRPGLVELGLHIDSIGSLGPLDTPRKVHEDHYQRMPAAAVANRGYGVLLTGKRKSKGRLSMVTFQLASLSDSILCGRFSYSRSCSGTGHPDERARVGVGGCSPRRVRECPSTATYPS